MSTQNPDRCPVSVSSVHVYPVALTVCCCISPGQLGRHVSGVSALPGCGRAALAGDAGRRLATDRRRLVAAGRRRPARLGRRFPGGDGQHLQAADVSAPGPAAARLGPVAGRRGSGRAAPARAERPVPATGARQPSARPAGRPPQLQTLPDPTVAGPRGCSRI